MQDDRTIHFCEFVTDRELMRLRRANYPDQPKRWTNNPILKKYSFCNINRQEDPVTQWIQEKIGVLLCQLGYDMFEDTHIFMANYFLARTYNEPKVLDLFMPFLTEEGIDRSKEVVTNLRKKGKKFMRGAYMMPTKTTGITVEHFYGEIAEQILNVNFSKCRSLEDISNAIMGIRGVGPFIANQTICDFKYVDIVAARKYPDLTDYVLAGPGTKRGINRFLGRDLKKGYTDEAARTELLIIRESIATEKHWLSFLPPDISLIWADPNNLSNCFCEYDKYCRAEEAETTNTKPKGLRLYHGNKTN